MAIPLLGRLEKVELRSGWSNEADDFTPWLAQEENLALLGDTIGLELELEAQEKNVGSFRADIVCKDTLADSWVLIENQLERTDHSHLGQLITYAAGLNAVTIVWIANRFTEEHRAALDWLNAITNESTNFFGLEIELWRISDSPLAPKFNIVSKPNDWTKTVTATRHQLEVDLTPTQQLQFEYWQTFLAYLEETNLLSKSRKSQAQNWLDFAVGRSGFQLLTCANMREKRIALQLVINHRDAKSYYRQLYQSKAAIEQAFGQPLEWCELQDRKSCTITLHNRAFDPNQHAQWPEQHAWLCTQLTALRELFSPRIKALDISGDFESMGNLSGEVQ